MSDRPVELLAENADCVVRGGEIPDQSLVTRRIGEFYLASCASPACLRRHGKPKHPTELENNHKLIQHKSTLPVRPVRAPAAVAPHPGLTPQAPRRRCTLVLQGKRARLT